MKTIKLSVALVLFSFALHSQDAKPRFEFGSTLLTINSFQNSGSYYMGKPPVEYINGLFFRYNINRLSLRFLTSYSDNTYSYSDPPQFADGSSSNGRNKDFRIGMGAQYSLLRTKQWLYAYTDILYRNVFSEGNYYGGIWGSADSYTSTSNGIDSFFGIGFKIKVFKSLYISPELGFNISASSVEKTTSPLRVGSAYSYNSIDVNANNILKLHLTVKF